MKIRHLHRSAILVESRPRGKARISTRQRTVEKNPLDKMRAGGAGGEGQHVGGGRLRKGPASQSGPKPKLTYRAKLTPVRRLRHISTGR